MTTPKSSRLPPSWHSNASATAMPSTTTSSIQCSSLPGGARHLQGPADYANFIVACLTHDIGYVRGVVKGDEDDRYVVDASERASFIAARLVRRRACAVPRRAVEAVRIGSRCGDRGARRRANRTRDRVHAFPYSSSNDDTDIDEEGALLRSADLIGQLGDPHYLRKANALYHEFEEIGLNRQLGYDRRRTSSTSIRNSIGTTSLRTSRPLSATSL